MAAALLGNLIYAGLATLLTTQANFGAINKDANLYSIATGIVPSAGADVALFQPGFPAQGTLALGANIGYGSATLQPLLFTRTGAVTVWYQGNTTAVSGDILVAYWHSAMR